MPETSKDLAETLRLHQANERTMLAWLRTGIALMAFGFAIARFSVFLRQVASLGPASLHPAPPGAHSAWVGAGLVVCGMLASLLGTIRYAQIRGAIERGSVGAPGARAVYALGGLLTLIGVAMTALLLAALGQ